MKKLRQMKQEMREIKEPKSLKDDVIKWALVATLISLVYLIFVFTTLKDDDKPPPLIANMYAQIEEHQKALVRAALRQTFSSFTIQDLVNFDLRDKFHNHKDFTEIDSLVDVRLKDGNLITIGYFDKEGIYWSLFK